MNFQTFANIKFSLITAELNLAAFKFISPLPVYTSKSLEQIPPIQKEFITNFTYSTTQTYKWMFFCVNYKTISSGT